MKFVPYGTSEISSILTVQGFKYQIRNYKYIFFIYISQESRSKILPALFLLLNFKQIAEHIFIELINVTICDPCSV